MPTPSLNLNSQDSEFISLPGTSSRRQSGTVMEIPDVLGQTFSSPGPSTQSRANQGPGRNDGPDDPPESGAAENSGDGGMDIFNVDPGKVGISNERLKQQARFLQSAYEKPPEGLYDPTKVNYEPYRRTLRKASEQQRQQLQELKKRNRKEMERSMFRTFWHMMGPEVFKTVSGAPVNTGTQESMRLAREARQQAHALERSGEQNYAQAERERMMRKAELDVQEEQQNAKREREAKRARYEAEQGLRGDLASAYQSLVEQQSRLDAAEKKAEAEEYSAWVDQQNSLREQFNDLVKEAGDDPQLWPRVESMARQLYPDASDEQIRRMIGEKVALSRTVNGEGGGEGPTVPQPMQDLAVSVSSFTDLKRQYDETDGWFSSRDTEYESPSGEQRSYLKDLEAQRVSLSDQVRRVVSDAERRIQKLESAGREVPQRLKNLVSTMKKKRDIIESTKVTDVDSADIVEQAIKPFQRYLNAVTSQTKPDGQGRQRPSWYTGPEDPANRYLKARYPQAFQGGTPGQQPSPGGGQPAPGGGQPSPGSPQVAGGQSGGKASGGQQSSAGSKLSAFLGKNGLRGAPSDSTGGEQRASDGQQPAPDEQPDQTAQGVRRVEQRLNEYEQEQGVDLQRQRVTMEELGHMSDEERQQLRGRMESNEDFALVVQQGENAQVVMGPNDFRSVTDRAKEQARQQRAEESMAAVGEAASEAVDQQRQKARKRRARRELRAAGIKNVAEGDTAEIVPRPDGKYDVKVIGPNRKAPAETVVPSREAAEKIRDFWIPKAGQ
ncbi:MAG: hypothetical protein BRD55_01330 [Bacteroidetes bacterium SW_9_63_38]|nr:MAG: hypothetical protein BRD55_01330 [Bacteroidetes bacterium SW_9_63_38]